MQLLTNVDDILHPLRGTALRDTTIVDLMNLIAVCVVSGNVRRTAQIALGSPHSKDYLNLKNYKINPHRRSFGWTSNNSGFFFLFYVCMCVYTSKQNKNWVYLCAYLNGIYFFIWKVFAELGMDYTDICERIRDNGEPGLCWLENMQQFGRMKDPVDKRDVYATGGAPYTAKYAYLYAKIVTLGDTPWDESNRVLHKNRRIGVSMSGLQQFVSKYGVDHLQTFCDEAYAMLKSLDQLTSQAWKINPSIKMTCIKPSGSISLLTGSTPGMHWPEASYYLRRVRIPKEAQGLVRPLMEANYPLEQAAEDENTLCVSFPVAVGDERIKSIHDVSMREQLEMAAFLQRHWCDNQVSVTVTFDNDREGVHLSNMLDEFQYKLKSVSFLPKFATQTTYPQMPYEAITKQHYVQLLQALKPLDFNKFSEAIDVDRDMEPHKFCDKDSCQM
ncbi:ribonucleoside triphosphate reductase [Reticulomyxa filosa]|uniref:Ribonucleoside triphosphate reductase n=1 Tax=Reticulomyxa filosa TaxID=46433 RepID=X6PET6_RETFI|nr:ribonucleoside triphosphate reductase [Reticulomyxa filosa]|eukprot:ETO36618.1 ribonucleoside triphosphate reductase [Reticulomyxa filosa]